MEALGVQGYARADAVRQASQLLRGTATEVVMELLQNARRAGATQIQITTTGGDAVAIDDNGSGMTNPERLLGFGESGWRRTPVGERPAGIGFFALAATGCIVRSTEQSATYRWWARLDPEHFRGEKAAPWHRAWRKAGDGHGTKVTVPLDLHKEWVLEDLVRHFRSKSRSTAGGRRERRSSTRRSRSRRRSGTVSGSRSTQRRTRGTAATSRTTARSRRCQW